MKQSFWICLFVLAHLTSVSQNANEISAALAKAPNDSVRVMLLSYQSEHAPDGVWEGYTVQLKELTQKKLEEEKRPGLKKFYTRYLASALNNLGLDESNKGHYLKAEEYWVESKKKAQEASDFSLEATALSNLCRQYYNKGQLEKAFEGFHQALKIYRSLSDTSRMATSLNYLGDIYRTQNDLVNAAKSYTEALHMVEAVHDRVRLADAYNRLGMVATLQKDEPVATRYYMNALSIYEQKGLTRGAISMQFQLGKLMSKMNKWREALSYYYETLNMLKKTQQDYILMNCLSSMGQAYYHLGQTDSAQHYFNRNILLDKDFKYPDILLETTKLSYLISKEQGKMTTALEMHELYIRAKDSLFNDNSRKAVLKSQYKYEYDKKALLDSLKAENEKNILEARRLKAETEKNVLAASLIQEKNQRYKIETEKNVEEAKRLKTETEKNVIEARLVHEKNERSKIEVEKNVGEARQLRTEAEKNIMEASLAQEKVQRYGLIGGLVLLTMTAGFGFSQFRTRQRLKELKLRNQIASDLHDEVGSAISSISLFAGMARMKNGKETEDLVEKIEETSRETINTMSDIVWSIEPSNDSFDNVLRKMKQFGTQVTAPLNIVFSFILDAGIEKLVLDMMQRKNIYLIYKESVNNACKHARATNLSVVLQRKSNSLVMQITDNGRGFDALEQYSGHGLASLKTRANDLQGKIEMLSSPAGTSVTLTVPL